MKQTLIVQGRAAHQKAIRNLRRLKADGMAGDATLKTAEYEVSLLAEFWNPRATQLALHRASQYV